MTPDPVPNKDQRRRSYAWDVTMWGAIAGVPVFAFGFIWSLFARPLDPWWAPIALGGLLLVACLVVAASYLHHHRFPTYWEELDRGMKVGANGEEAYNARWRLQRLEDILFYAVAGADVEVDLSELHAALRSVTITVVDRELLPVAGVPDPAGKTYWNPRSSVVEFKHSRSLGTIGWEAYLQICDYIAPDEVLAGGELAKHDWGVKVGILPLDAVRRDVSIPPLDVDQGGR